MSKDKQTRSKRTVKKTNNHSSDEHKSSSKHTKVVKNVKRSAKSNSKSDDSEHKSSKAKNNKLSVLEAVKDLKFRDELAELRNEVEEMGQKYKVARSHLKKLESTYVSDLKKAYHSKKSRKTNNKPTGFIKGVEVPKKLAKFIGVETGTVLSTPEITKKVWAELENRGLQYENDKRVFRTNKEVSDVFGVPKSVNKSFDHKDKEGFNFCNIQKYIKNAVNNA